MLTTNVTHLSAERRGTKRLSHSGGSGQDLWRWISRSEFLLESGAGFSLSSLRGRAAKVLHAVLSVSPDTCTALDGPKPAAYMVVSHRGVRASSLESLLLQSYREKNKVFVPELSSVKWTQLGRHPHIDVQGF